MKKFALISVVFLFFVINSFAQVKFDSSWVKNDKTEMFYREYLAERDTIPIEELNYFDECFKLSMDTMSVRIKKVNTLNSFVEKQSEISKKKDKQLIILQWIFETRENGGAPIAEKTFREKYTVSDLKFLDLKIRIFEFVLKEEKDRSKINAFVEETIKLF